LKRTKASAKRVVAEVVAHLVQLLAEGVAARMLAQHQVRFGQADILGPHDLVGAGVLEHPVLMDAALMREGVLADDGLVELHREAGDRRDQPARRHDLRRVDLGARTA
jgi:hypothetical protein